MTIPRRTVLKSLLAGSTLCALPAAVLAETAQALTETMQQRPIPSSGQALPVIGFGTWRTFDQTLTEANRHELSQVLRILHQHGGTVIDSSPMYGRAEAVVGELTQGLALNQAFFFATKVWTHGRAAGIEQMKQSLDLLQREQLELMQVHNLVDWRTHLNTLRAWREEGKIRYLGVTHYLLSSFEQLEKLLKTEALDFIQLPYSIGVRAAEHRLLPLAQEVGTAVIVNRPYEGGQLFRKAQGQTLPEWAAEFDCQSWGQFFLKFILAHPAVTCVIPGTGKITHAQDNVAAGFGRLPDTKQRQQMMAWFEKQS